MGFRALEAAENVVWAMERAALEALLVIAAREHQVTPEALEAYQAKSLKNAEQATVRNGVAIIPANGAMFKRANLLTAMSGATSYDVMRKDLQSAVDQKLKGAILYLDTPGGEASGAGELASYIASLRGKFPVVAYISGMGASAGYWIASAAQEIIIDPSAIVGSIGVQWAMSSRDDPKGVTTHTFISSQSPLKNADPASEAGALQIQSVVDAMAQVFVETVAANRGVATETVLSDFGKGGILVGKDAVAAGMADRLGTFESVLAEFAAPRRSGRSKGVSMSDEKTFTAAELQTAVAAQVAEAVAASNARVSAVTEIGSNLGASAADISAAITAGTAPDVFALEQSRKVATARAEATAAAAEVAAASAVAGVDKSKRIDALKTDEELAAEAAASTGAEPVGGANAGENLVAQILADAGVKKVN